MRSLSLRWFLLGLLASSMLIFISCGGNESDEDFTASIPLLFTDNGNGTITDDITGLMWQKEDDGETYTWEEAAGVCASLELGGYSDWRVPSVKELMSIVVYERYDPAIHSTYFPGVYSSSYWSATELAGFDSEAYEVEFLRGASHQVSKDDPLFVRCVRSRGLPEPEFMDNADGTVSDRTTSLMWQQDTGPLLLWQESKDYCTGLSLANHQDWRMPTIRELITLIDYSGLNPTIDTLYFPNTYPSVHGPYYWSSTVASHYWEFDRWWVNFYFGTTHTGGGGTGWVRCVRHE